MLPVKRVIASAIRSSHVAVVACCLRRSSRARMLRLSEPLRLSGSGGGIVGVTCVMGMIFAFSGYALSLARVRLRPATGVRGFYTDPSCPLHPPVRVPPIHHQLSLEEMRPIAASP